MDADGGLCEEVKIADELESINVYSSNGLLTGFSLQGDLGAIYDFGTVARTGEESELELQQFALSGPLVGFSVEMDDEGRFKSI